MCNLQSPPVFREEAALWHSLKKELSLFSSVFAWNVFSWVFLLREDTRGALSSKCQDAKPPPPTPHPPMPPTRIPLFPLAQPTLSTELRWLCNIHITAGLCLQTPGFNQWHPATYMQNKRRSRRSWDYPIYLPRDCQTHTRYPPHTRFPLAGHWRPKRNYCNLKAGLVLPLLWFLYMKVLLRNTLKTVI